MKKYYINALKTLLKEGGDIDVVLKNFDAFLLKKGHVSIKGAVLRGLLQNLVETQKQEMPVLSLAHKNGEKKYELEIKKAKEKLSLKGNVAVEIDETLIGGFFLRTQNNRIDESHKSKLQVLYRSIIK